jgi:hypothetical protein
VAGDELMLFILQPAGVEAEYDVVTVEDATEDCVHVSGYSGSDATGIYVGPPLDRGRIEGAYATSRTVILRSLPLITGSDRDNTTRSVVALVSPLGAFSAVSTPQESPATANILNP